MDAAALPRELAAANVTVLTSSGGRDPSLEDEAWQHGAFTRVVLGPLWCLWVPFSPVPFSTRETLKKNNNGLYRDF